MGHNKCSTCMYSKYLYGEPIIHYCNKLRIYVYANTVPENQMDDTIANRVGCTYYTYEECPIMIRGLLYGRQ